MRRQSFLVLFFLCLFGISLPAQTVVINEIMASNVNTIADENGQFEDWIELYNPSSGPVNLLGYGLSDDPANLFRWVFPDVTLQSGAYLLVWASGYDRMNDNAFLHTNFSLSASGEDVLLTNPDSVLVDFISYPQLLTDISYGKKPGADGNWMFFKDATPGYGNTTKAYEGILDSPVFSHESGFYSDGFALDISSQHEGVKIFYTTDGSPPDENAIVFGGPIDIVALSERPNNLSMIPTNHDNNPGPPYYEGWQPPTGEVEKAVVVRAYAVKENYLPSESVTHSFLIDGRGAERYSLPVFFLSTDPKNLFDRFIGIYVPGNYNNMFGRGDTWERPVHLSMFESGGRQVFSENMGVRIHGGTTRSRPRKSLRFYLRDTYGNPWLNYQLFPEKEVDQFKRFLLRNSGNDWDQSVFRDGFMQFLVRNLHVETQYYRPAILFINGEYWGINNIRDRYDEQYIFSHYGLEEHEMVVLQNNSEYAYGNAEGADHYVQMLEFMKGNSMADQDGFEWVETMMDMESFTDFQIAHIYIMNTDWPGNNTNFWRRLTAYDPEASAGFDGRWRWMMLDTDFGFGLNFHYVPGVDEGPAHNTLAMALEGGHSDHHWPNPDWSTLILRSLLANTGFKNHFINRFADLLNTTFKETRVVAVLDSIESVLLPEMQEHIDRWRRPVTMQEWLQNVEVMRHFARQRPSYMRNYIRDAFGLHGTFELELGINRPYMGQIRVNTVKPVNEGIWKGVYFMGIPIELEASARPGYRFSHWTGADGGSEEVLSFIADANTSLLAHFELDPDYEGEILDPPPYDLASGPYVFDSWDADHPQGSFPPNMMFQQSSKDDPGISDEMTHPYHIPDGEYHEDDLDLIGFPYKLSGRTRLNGLGDDGISFINTGRGRDLGAAVLALDTRGLENITVSFTGATLIPNARAYAIRLQYKIGPDGSFKDVSGNDGKVVEYKRSSIEQHEEAIGPFILPAEANDRSYVQLRWKYYFTGERLDADHGRRDMLRLDDILVTTSEKAPDELVLNIKMRVWAQKYHRFDPDKDYVDVAGTFNGWDGESHRLQAIPGDPDLTHTITIGGLEPGTEYQFKFRINGSWDQDYHEFPNHGPNRRLIMMQGKNEHTFWFNDEDPSTSIRLTERPAVIVYPNPSGHTLHIASDTEIQEVRLVNIMGQVVYSLNAKSEHLRFSVSGFEQGVYFLLVSCKGGVVVERILIRP